MSVLQEILQKMYVEPEILADLDDEQKHILFCQMREEQIRRWTSREKESETKERQHNSATGSSSSSSGDSSGKKVRWLLGRDGNPWVWVMGEHQDDKTIDEILEKETQEKARRLAEQEAEELRRIREEELKETLRQEQLEAEEERLKIERHRQIAAAQQAQEEEAVRQRIEQEKAKKLLENEQNEVAAVLSRQAEEALLKRELQQQQHQQFGPWQENGEEVVVERRGRTNGLNEEELVERRQSEIYQTLTEAREKANQEAEKEEEEERRYWEEQERKAREAEEQIRSIARRAREQHKEHSLRTSTSLLSLFKSEAQGKKHVPPNAQCPDAADGVVSTAKDSRNGNADNSPALSTNHVTTAMKLPRPPKPQSRDAIVQWYLKEELPAGNGLIHGTSRVAPWFHGIINREEAEQLLRPPRAAGAFLVRVSARIWGYTISHKVDDVTDRVKHFLIEKVTENGSAGYQLYGTNQLVHASLWELVSYHKTVPITAKGGELLKEPVGQVRFPPDYQELLGFGNTNSGPTDSQHVRRPRP